MSRIGSSAAAQGIFDVFFVAHRVVNDHAENASHTAMHSNEMSREFVLRNRFSLEAKHAYFTHGKQAIVYFSTLAMKIIMTLKSLWLSYSTMSN